MTYNVFGGTLNLAQSIPTYDSVILDRLRFRRQDIIVYIVETSQRYLLYLYSTSTLRLRIAEFYCITIGRIIPVDLSNKRRRSWRVEGEPSLQKPEFVISLTLDHQLSNCDRNY